MAVMRGEEQGIAYESPVPSSRGGMSMRRYSFLKRTPTSENNEQERTGEGVEGVRDRKHSESRERD